MPLFGAHISVAGGIVNIFERSDEIGGEAIQIFTKNQRRWTAPPLDEDTASEFRRAYAKNGSPPITSHGAYLLNLASGKDEQVSKTLENLSDELTRCQMLGVPYVVIHPGSHGGDGLEVGIKRIADNIERAFELSGAKGVMVLLETTSGMGHSIGSEFAHLRDIIAASPSPERLGVCIDSCHIFAAGYELRTAAGYEMTMREVEETVTLEKVRFFHLNDSLGARGSKRDRHTHIGEGEIGKRGFANLVNDPRFYAHPMVLETPTEPGIDLNKRNIRVLKSLLKG